MSFSSPVPPDAPVEDVSETSSGTADSSTQNLSSRASLSQDPASFSTTKPTFSVSAGGGRRVIAGSLVEFSASAIGTANRPVYDARFLWNFGDGRVQEGIAVSHTFTYPGRYVVVLDVASGRSVATDRIVVEVKEAQLMLSIEDDTAISITNAGGVEADISGFKLTDDRTSFFFPQNTILLPNNTHRFAHAVTGLATEPVERLALYYPNGVLFQERTYRREVVEFVPEETIVQANHARIDKTPESLAEASSIPEVKPPSLVSETPLAQEELLVLEPQQPTETIAADIAKRADIFQGAGVASVSATSGDDIYRWITLVFSVVVIASFLLLARKPELKEVRQGEVSAKDITILE
jgi:hypothetical protein